MIDATEESNGPWNPGIQSQVPAQLLHLCTIFRPEHVFTSLASAYELHGLTGISPSELVAFRPQRLALHELMIRVTADVAVPDGSRVEDLGIKFREIVSLIFSRYIEPEMETITSAYQQSRREVEEAVRTAQSHVNLKLTELSKSRVDAPRTRLLPRFRRRHSVDESHGADYGWGLNEIGECEKAASLAHTELQRIAYRALARVMSGLFTINGRAWGTQDLIASVTTDMVSNEYGSEAIGRSIEPILRRAARNEGYDLLPRQERPVVINIKGPSASGKSTLRPLQKEVARHIGLPWNHFALISPDIWRKQLLEYGSLGSAYKYGGAFTAEELQIIDQKLDRYMARKNQHGAMSHLLIDRFRFDSFANDSDEAGSNFLTRFGSTVHLFFLITAPESLVERAWKRGLEVGRFKAVDDTLAHAVQAYSGMPDVFFTWIRRRDKLIRFEFLDNSVRLGERPRTAAFGENDICNVLDVKCMLDIERYCRVNVWATKVESLYPDRCFLAAEHNIGVLRRCLVAFRQVNFADQNSGLIYLRFESGEPVFIDSAGLQRAVADLDTDAVVRAIAPGALGGTVARSDRPLYLHEVGEPGTSTLGEWGDARRMGRVALA